MALVAGSVLENRYRIEQLVGQGGMGAVYSAYDTGLHQVVAIKENTVGVPGMSPEADEASRRQFEHEALVLARVRHPNLPRVIDHFITPDGNQYLVMDFVEGEDLAQIIARRGPVPEAQALAWIGQICSALEYLHSQKPPIIHRDIKPQNVKVTPNGHVYLVDFGISKLGGVSSETTAGALSVTRGFSPPEQYAMSGTDARTDIYALGATLYALITGHVPPDSISLQSGEAQLIPPRQFNAGVSLAVQQAVLKAMQPRRTERPQSVSKFWEMLIAESGEERVKTVALVDEAAVPEANGLKRISDRVRAVALRRGARTIVSIRESTRIRLVLLGTGAVVILAALFASSFAKPAAQRVSQVPTPLPTTQTATPEVMTIANLTPTAVLTETDIARQTEAAKGTAQWVAFAETAAAGATAVQQAVNATATRQAEFLECNTIEYQVLTPPINRRVAILSATNVELTWRVRNTAAPSTCKWGQTGQETQLLRAIAVSGRVGIGTPVKLKWIQNDEYDLSLSVQLDEGWYNLSWKLVVPKTGLPAGPDLAATVNVTLLTPRPTFTPTPVPTLTPCPTETYQCHCVQVCVGRDCKQVCDECTRPKCN